ncbi:hypothetical protein DID77_00095 [Candidatus Marinamargulisbacteria bacterium SCGC AG-439-L15]|nr:hypothetical protein DID77_00095 [Candidatus Marinamargulisbacteria bacterium SCGC AG-439-L15]
MDSSKNNITLGPINLKPPFPTGSKVCCYQDKKNLTHFNLVLEASTGSKTQLRYNSDNAFSPQAQTISVCQLKDQLVTGNTNKEVAVFDSAGKRVNTVNISSPISTITTNGNTVSIVTFSGTQELTL